MRRVCAAGVLLTLACGPVRVSPYSRELHRVGRFDDRDPAGPKFDWSGSRVSFRFYGDSVRLRVKQATRPPSAEAGPQPLRVRVELDGRPHEIYANEQNELELRAELPPGRHRVSMIRQSEALVGQAQLVEVELGPGGKLLPWDERGRPLLEFVGDSITVGFGNEGSSPCPFSSRTQAITQAFPWLVGEQLRADVRVLGWSGHGVTRNWADRPEPVVPEQWAPAAPAPDAVLVALGANDFWNGDPGPEPFSSAYAAFIARVRGAYPNAVVYAIITPTGEDRRAALRQYLGPAGVPILELGEMPASDGRGCAGHPSARSHRRAAAEISARLCADVPALCRARP